MLDAVADAGLKVEDIDYVNVHGTSTPVGDIAEIKGLFAAFGDHIYNLNISSTKSMTGTCWRRRFDRSAGLRDGPDQRDRASDDQQRKPRSEYRSEAQPDAQRRPETRCEVLR